MKGFVQAVVAFFGVFGELFNQAFQSLKTDSVKYKAEQDKKFEEESSKPIVEE